MVSRRGRCMSGGGDEKHLLAVSIVFQVLAECVSQGLRFVRLCEVLLLAIDHRQGVQHECGQ